MFENKTSFMKLFRWGSYIPLRLVFGMSQIENGLCRDQFCPILDENLHDFELKQNITYCFHFLTKS